jgi:hypothetical protein
MAQKALERRAHHLTQLFIVIDYENGCHDAPLFSYLDPPEVTFSEYDTYRPVTDELQISNETATGVRDMTTALQMSE